jgi:D-alanyl-D-alanine carboxypeptidase/D-alanyl-D-alanine-endopeptidase (penicillin-binding protein 4)
MCTAVIAASPVSVSESAAHARKVALDRARVRGGLAGARLGILVTRARDGAVLYEHGADTPLIPASNMKILTAMAALERFGPTHRFTTLLRSPAPPDAEGAIGELVVVGGGDPVLNSEDWWRVASGLRSAGVRRVTGDLVVDERAFDDVRWHPDWGRASSRAYHAPITGLTANYGAYFVQVRPGAKVGDPVEVEIDPPLSYFVIDNQAKTSARASRPSLMVDRGRSADRETVKVAGSMRLGSKADTFPRSAADPALYAGAVLEMQLRAVGIEVGGRVRRGRAEEAPHELLAFEGRTLSEIVLLFMKYSNNAIAESLVKSMGRAATGEPGSWPTGLAAMDQSLSRLGVIGPGTRIVDGSGLSTSNRVSARSFEAALALARHSFAYGPEMMSAFPLAAADGTLEKRAQGLEGRVRAKTGLLSDARVTSLSGYAQLADGELAIFSVIVNDFQKGARAAMDGVDAFVGELVKHGSSLEARPKAAAEPGRGSAVGVWAGDQELEASVILEPAS